MPPSLFRPYEPTGEGRRASKKMPMIVRFELQKVDKKPMEDPRNVPSCVASLDVVYLWKTLSLIFIFPNDMPVIRQHCTTTKLRIHNSTYIAEPTSKGVYFLAR